MRTLELKKILPLIFLATVWTIASGQQNDIEVPGDHFSLEGALELFKQSATPQDFEKALNSPDSKVNNLDLNGDGYVDYIRVVDIEEGNVHAFILQAVVSETESQDVAVIELEKLANGKAVLQITGDEDVYGIETIIEPTKEVRVNAGTTTSRTVVNVWTWPVVRYVYAPTYTLWVSPWSWAYRPIWWSTWTPVAYHVYSPWWRPYRPYYSICHTHRISYATRIYQPYRTTSVIVHNRHHDRIVRYRSTHQNYGRNHYATHSPRHGHHTNYPRGQRHSNYGNGSSGNHGNYPRGPRHNNPGNGSSGNHGGHGNGSSGNHGGYGNGNHGNGSQGGHGNGNYPRGPRHNNPGNGLSGNHGSHGNGSSGNHGGYGNGNHGNGSQGGHGNDNYPRGPRHNNQGNGSSGNQGGHGSGSGNQGGYGNGSSGNHGGYGNGSSGNHGNGKSSNSRRQDFTPHTRLTSDFKNDKTQPSYARNQPVKSSSSTASTSRMVTRSQSPHLQREAISASTSSSRPSYQPSSSNMPQRSSGGMRPSTSSGRSSGYSAPSSGSHSMRQAVPRSPSRPSSAGPRQRSSGSSGYHRSGSSGHQGSRTRGR